MGYVVRTPDGEMVYPSMPDLVQAYAMGLVDPEDEVREEDAAGWRKAGSIPGLAAARRASADTARWKQLWPVLGVVVIAVAALRVLYRMQVVTQETRNSWSMLLLGIMLTLAASLLLTRYVTRLNRKALEQKSPRRPPPGS